MLNAAAYNTDMQFGCPVQRPIKVMALIEAYSLTGPAKNLIEFARNVATRGGDAPPAMLSIVTFQRHPDYAPNAFIRTASDAGVAVHIIRERSAFDFGIISQLQRLIETHQPDIIQSHNLKSHFLTRLAGLHRGRNWIAFHHGYTWTDLKLRALNQLNRWSLRAADRVVTVCGAFSRELEQCGVQRDRIAILHNTVKQFVSPPVEEVTRVRQSFAVATGMPLLLTVGRLSLEKGHLDLIRSVARLRDMGSPVQLVIAGEGPERRRIERLCQSLAVTSSVVLAGHRENLSHLYAAADMFVLPSYTEGSPNVVLEAMAAGLPIVATAVGGVPEIIRHESTGLLVKARDPNSIAAAVHRLLGDKELRRSLSTQAKHESIQFSSSAYCDSMLQLYDSLVNAEARVAKRSA